MTSFNPDCLPKAQFPNAITVVGSQHINWRGGMAIWSENQEGQMMYLSLYSKLMAEVKPEVIFYYSIHFLLYS